MRSGSLADRVEVLVEGGRGGDGVSSFRREKYVPRGGPDGGDGGDGGSVILRVDGRCRTLLDFRYRRHYRAGRGTHGKGKQMHGRRGKDLVLRIPPGTQVFVRDTGIEVADLVSPGQELVAARGGRGGRGNVHFKSSTNQAPRRAERGAPGEIVSLLLELKLLADVGLVGLPNAGKSTLLRRVTSARPRVADYPFTTLDPVLGLVRPPDGPSFVMADIPGLVEGAHEGKGMGHAFLRHIERTRALVILLDAAGGDPARDRRLLEGELKLYRRELLDRPRVVVFNKLDLIPAERRRTFSDLSPESLWISAATGEGVRELLLRLVEILSREESS